MRAPVFLFALWALWPIAAYPGGNLFAPLVFILGLFALRTARQWRVRAELLGVVGFLAWVCLTALWSPASAGLFSGSLVSGDFAVEAAHLRFVATAIGCILFVSLVTMTDPDALRRAMPWVCTGIAVQLVIVSVVAFKRDDLLLAQGHFGVSSVQSMGRNANFLAMAIPILIGALLIRVKGPVALVGAGLIGVATLAFAVMLDGMAVLLAAALGVVSIGVLAMARRSGFRVLFNLFGLGVLLAPALAWLQGAVLPARAADLPLSTEHRFMIWHTTLEKIVEKPILGHGVNAASTWRETFAARPDLLADMPPEFGAHRLIPTHPHNMSLQIWAETGLVGAVLVAVTLVLVGRALPRPETMTIPVRVAAGGLFGAALTYFAVSYSVWDETFWASVAVVFSGVVVLARSAET